MNFSYSKLTTLRPQKEKRLATFLIALATAATLFVPYMIAGEGYFTFYGDFNVQQIPFYQLCHKAILTGDISWSWNTDLGANFIGSYSFYCLGSPFFWITLLFPNNFVPYLMGPLLILKFACAALTAYLFIRRFTKTSNAAMLGGLLYAFSGFSVYNIFFNHFHEAIIIFPLLLLSIELLITENRRGVFALAVFASAIINYFFFFGMVVFCIIYFFVRLFSGAIKVKMGRFLILVVEAVLGLAMAAVLLLPSYFAVDDNNRLSSILLGWNGITYGKEQIYLNIIECFFFPPDLPARPVYFPGANVKWSSLGGWLPVFSMTGVFVWCINRKGSWLKRVIGVCIFMAMVPILNSMFYAFNTAYYARWFYMPILMMCLATVMLTEDASVDWSSGFRWTAFITVLFTITIGLFPQQGEDGLIFGLYTQHDKNLYAWRFWISCTIAIVSLVVLFILIKLMKRNRTAFYRLAIAAVCVVSAIYGNVFVFGGRTHSYEIKEVVIDQLIEGQVNLERDSEYRIDVYDGVDNTGMFLELPTINAFHSVVPSSIMEFYEFIDVERTVGSRPDVEVDGIRPLLSVKYLLNRSGGDSFIKDSGETQMPGYEYVKTSGGYYVYENLNYIPYGFSYDYYMTEDFCEAYGSGKSRARMMLKAMILTPEQATKYSGYMDDIDDIDTGDMFSPDYDGVSLSLSDAQMEADCERLAATSAFRFSTDNNGFSASVRRDKKSLVFFSVPYDEGWSATVNGKPVDVEKVNIGFMAVPVDAGDSEIRFTYTTPGLETGIYITIGAFAVFLIYYLAATIYARSNPIDTEYPEGDELLEQWHSDDIALAISEHMELEREERAERKSLFDELPEIQISPLEEMEEGFKGGFNVDTSQFEDEENDNS